MPEPRGAPPERRRAAGEVGPRRAGRGLPDRLVGMLRRDVPLVFLDAAIAFGVYVGLLVVRVPVQSLDRFWSGFWVFLLVAIVVHLSSNYLFGLYGQMWRHAGVQEARRVLLAGASALVAIVVWGEAIGGHPAPRTVVLLGPVLAFLGFGVLRFQSRLFGFHRRSIRREDEQRVVIFGTGEAGAMVLRDIQAQPALGLRPVALLDDDPSGRGLSLHGVPVLGGREALGEVVDGQSATQVLLAVPSATNELVQDLAARCEEAGVPLKVLPSMREIVGGRVGARDIRDLRLEDLLGRGQVDLDLASVRRLLQGRRVLITGGGGSIGSEIARQVAAFAPSALVLLDHDETHLFEAAQGLPSGIGLRQVLTDVRDRQQVIESIAVARPDIVFHAAAHKHVPLMEAFPREAARTNVLGTANVIDACAQAHVARFVFISTDKAIRPAGVMGASKRLAEEVVRGFLRNGTVSCAVRFGNVLGSRGSVVPTFLRQIEAGGPVTVTDPDMTRYFMSIPEAVQLVLQAAALSEGGEVFTLDMGTPVRIDHLARKVIRLAGKVPDKDVAIVYTGVRPGEKLSEDVRDHGEQLLPSGHPSILVTRPPAPEQVRLRRTLQAVESLCEMGLDADLTELLRRPETLVVPEAEEAWAGER